MRSRARLLVALLALSACAAAPSEAAPRPGAEAAPQTGAEVAAALGFEEIPADGALWIFRAESEALAAFRASGAPSRYVVRPGAGPGGLALRAPDAGTLDAYLAARARASQPER